MENQKIGLKRREAENTEIYHTTLAKAYKKYLLVNNK